MSINKIKDYKISASSWLLNNKVQWKVDKNKCVLLIHDMQEYFLDPFNRQSIPYITLLSNIKNLKETCKKYCIPVIYTAQPPGQTQNQRGIMKDFWGCGIPKDLGKEKIVKELSPEENDIVLTKCRYSAYEKTSLNKIIEEHNRSQIIITGVYSHIGCLATATSSFMKDIQPFLISDATADFSREKHEFALKYVSDLTGMVLSTNEVIKEINLC
ncbi:MAG: isochorismatase family protein [Peptostreptococcus sp.]|uniref:isochorismatase family protein n=1 Tax=Peptostreptococcus sp. TaxID=1262 RepID=UPI000763BC42|nr:isochorismatase family protein [Peptostreptococcus sp.]KWZ94685.1 isochorismatase family protein [Anaerococcus hydrogenalis]MDU5350758.1 isochorismatase family protein [Peptostreptococcus sp.]MDU5890378.1 isochorismatase family protein [Peptostreptococcus sp.]HES4526392.1 isochorismatase family protein [Streptococcus pyogenes]